MSEIIYKENDPDMPQELKDLLVRILTKHVENTTNPHYIRVLDGLWMAMLRHAPNEEIKMQHALLCKQEVEHGVINAMVLKGLGVEKVTEPFFQYLFDIPLECWTDVALIHGIGDRVGMYIGELWEDVPYEPLRKVAPRLHKEEVFHVKLGMAALKNICKTEDGLSEANERLKVWWPAALDMFGKSGSGFSEKYVKWGIRTKGNEELRQEYIREARPELEALGLTVPDDTANRQFL